MPAIGGFTLAMRMNRLRRSQAWPKQTLHFSWRTGADSSTCRQARSGHGSYRETGGHWAASGPMVFLNACGTDQSERTYTGVMDWAQKCFEAGASAFVGSLWDVRSKPARAFATCFYEKLFDDGQPLAVAAHLARQQARQKSGKDPTWLAYTVYGNPFARVVST
jgi:hypothetical protein